MEIEWTAVDKADSYEVTYNNLETEHVRTLTGITTTNAVLMDHSTFIGRATTKNKGKNFKSTISTTILSVVREGMSRHINWRLHL